MRNPRNLLVLVLLFGGGSMIAPASSQSPDAEQGPAKEIRKMEIKKGPVLDTGQGSAREIKKAPAMRLAPPSLQCSITAHPSPVAGYQIPDNAMISHENHPLPYVVYWRMKISNTGSSNAQGCRLTIQPHEYMGDASPPFRCTWNHGMRSENPRIIDFDLDAGESYETVVSRNLGKDPGDQSVDGCYGRRQEVLVERCGAVRRCTHTVYYY